MAFFQPPREWMSLGTYREPAPRRLTWEELLAEEFTPSARPEPINDLSGLAPEERRRARQDSVFSGLASIGALLQGDQRRATAGIGELADIRDRAIAGGNARLEGAWQQENQQRAAEAERGKREQGAKALFGMYEHVSEGETPAFAQRAEQAARAGSMAELTKMDQERGMRARSREVGFNPDDYTIEELQQRLAEALEARKAAEAARLKEEETRRLGTIKNELDREQEDWLAANQRGSYRPPQYEPLDRIAAKERLVQGIRAEYAAKTGTGSGAIHGRLGQAPNGMWGMIEPPSEAFPRGRFTPIDGQPVKEGKLVKFMRDNEPYIFNEARPELGAIPMKVYEQGDGSAPSLNELRVAGGKTPPPAVAAQATKRLSAVKDPGTVKKIQDARAAGYTDSEIAAFLGLH